MNLSFLLILVSFMFFHVRAQEPAKPGSSNILRTFHPSATLVIGVFVGMLSLTFLLLIYLKIHQANLDNFRLMFSSLIQDFHVSPQSSMSSGIDRKTIESIPFFHFSALKGSKEGLECAVCISAFEDADVLRFLPKCKHAFHRNCIDQWLERHSTCPLCRYKFDATDLNAFIHSNSLRLSRNPSNLSEDPNVELFVEREQDNNQLQRSSSRFNIGSSFRGIDRGKKQELLTDQQGEASCEDDKNLLHKFRHKIIVSDVVIKSRWSDVCPSDLLSLNSEMLSVMSSRRFSALESNSRRFSIGLSTSEQIEKGKEDSMLGTKDGNDSSSNFPSASYDESKSSKINHTRKRSVSEITIFPRVQQFRMENQISPVSNGGKEERIKRLWLPIVRKTVQWFSGQERYLHGSQNNRQRLNV